MNTCLTKFESSNKPLQPSTYKFAHQMSLVLAALLSLVSNSVQAQNSARQCQFTELRLCAPTNSASDFSGAGDYEKGDPGCGSAKEIMVTYYPLSMHSGAAVLDSAGVYKKQMVGVVKLRDYRFIHNGDRYLTSLRPSSSSGDIELMVIRKNPPRLVELWAGSCASMYVDDDALLKKLKSMAK